MITFLVMKTELLAPAGSMAGLKAVIAAGADAVYIGGSRFGARAYADNPEETDLLHGIDYAHLRGAKVYLTVNTLLKNSEMKELCEWLLPYVRCGVDAVLVQDFGVLKRLRETFPELPLHASTQMTVTGPLFASLLKEYGVTRIVPARELSIQELKKLKEESGLEVEVFIHGALCYCYSGQCLMSSLIGGRSGNRGRCAQPCRLLTLLNDKESFSGKTSILDRKDARHFLSPKDLCAAELLPELIAAGMDSLKIEGRMKQPEYAAGVVSIYRALLDRCAEGMDKKDFRYRVTKEESRKLYDLYNRSGFTDGYFHRHNGPEMMALVKHELTAEETRARHDLYDEMHAVYMDKEKTVPAEAEISVFSGKPVTMTVRTGSTGQRPEADSGITEVRVSGIEAESARMNPLTEERIRENAAKTGGTDFHFTKVRVHTDGNSFVRMSAINEVRRLALASLKEEMLAPFRRPVPDFTESGAAASAEKTETEKPKSAGETGLSGKASAELRAEIGDDEQFRKASPELRAVIADDEQFRAALRVPAVSRIYAEAAWLYSATDPAGEAVRFIRKCKEAGKEAGIAMPRIDRAGSDVPALKEAAERLISEGLRTFLVRSTETLAFFLKQGLGAFVQTDAGIYTYNEEARAFLKNLGIQGDTAPLELNNRELSGTDHSGSEIIVYGLLPLMVSAQCLKKNTDTCTRRNERMTLTDRTGTKFTVKCECVFCYNVLYNFLPLSLLSEMEKLKRMNFTAVRLDFSSESGSEAGRILQDAADALEGKEIHLLQSFTRGHFQRGVE